MSDIRYYVFTNDGCSYHNDIYEAMEKFTTINKDASIGIEHDVTIKSGICFDLIASWSGTVYRINDYQKKLADFELSKYHPEIEEAVKIVSERFNPKYELDSEKIKNIRKYSFILLPIDDCKYTYSNDKFPILKDQVRFQLNSCINELYIKDKGWKSYEEFLKEDKCVLLQVNVNYVDAYGGISQMDMPIKEYIDFVNRYSNKYKLTMYDERIDKDIVIASFSTKEQAIMASYELQLPYIGAAEPVNVIDENGWRIHTSKKGTEYVNGYTKEAAIEHYNIKEPVTYDVNQDILSRKNIDELYKSKTYVR